MSELKLKGIIKSYGNKNGKGAVFQCKVDSFYVEEGRIHTLLGPSGCGKTTLLKIMAGLEEPDAGVVMMDGEDVTNLPVEKRHVGMVFQKPLLFPHMTVLENVVFPLLKNHDRKNATELAMDMLSQVGLVDHARQMPRQLSGGQAQRVAFARAMVLKPRLLLLDEPLSALDQTLRKEMIQLIKDISRIHGMTMVHVTHDVNEAVALADRMTLMHMGGVLETGEVQTMLKEPRRVETARLMGFSNVIEADGGLWAFKPCHGKVLGEIGGTCDDADLIGIIGTWIKSELTLDGTKHHYETDQGQIAILSDSKTPEKNGRKERIVVSREDAIIVNGQV